VERAEQSWDLSNFLVWAAASLGQVRMSFWSGGSLDLQEGEALIHGILSVNLIEPGLNINFHWA